MPTQPTTRGGEGGGDRVIEINRGKSPYIFRQNPFNPLIIDRRKNRHGARWQWFRLCKSEEEARAALLKLETKEGKP